MPNIPPIRTPLMDANGNMTRDWLKWFQGVQSVVGVASTVTFAAPEVPVGAIDGANKVFTLAHTPVAGIDLYVRGIWQRPGTDYGLTGATITFSTAPVASALNHIHVGTYAY